MNMKIYIILSLMFLILGFIFSIINVFRKKSDDSAHYIKSQFIKLLPYCFFIISSIFIYLDASNSLFLSIYNGIGCFIHVNTDYIKTDYIMYMNSFATIVTIAAFISGLRDFLKLCIYYVAEKVFKKIIYIIHGNSEIVETLQKNFEKKFSIIITNGSTEKYYNKFNNHIIAYDNNDENLKVASDIVLINKQSNVYTFSNINNFVLFNNRAINILDKNELIIDDFWSKYYENIFKIFSSKNFNNCRLTIVGSNNLSYQFFLRILKNCIYDLNQSININVLTTVDMLNYFKIADMSIKDKMTRDTITINEIDVNTIYDMQESDIVLITDQSLLSTISMKYRYGQNIYLYSPGLKQDDYAGITNINENIKPNDVFLFGSNSEIYDIENIIKNRKITIAKLANYGYAMGGECSIESIVKKEKYENEWNKLSIYNIFSNYALADYYDTREMIINVNKDQNDVSFKNRLIKIEHIRWCRFMYLEGFKYLDRAFINKEDKKEKINMKLHHSLRTLDDKIDSSEQKKDEYVYAFIKNNLDD